jgi:hypothetical protein
VYGYVLRAAPRPCLTHYGFSPPSTPPNTAGQQEQGVKAVPYGEGSPDGEPSPFSPVLFGARLKYEAAGHRPRAHRGKQ